MTFRERISELEGAFDRDSFAFMLEEGVEGGRKAIPSSKTAVLRSAIALSDLRQRYDNASPVIKVSIWAAVPLSTYLLGLHYTSRCVERAIRYCKLPTS